MTTVPNLSGLSSSAAQSAIISAGLTFDQATTTSSGASSGNNGTVSSSSIASGTLVDYETSISIVLYSYSAPPPPPPPPPPPTNECSDWTFGNYWDREECINGSLYSEAGYYEFRNCSITGYETRDIVTYPYQYCCSCTPPPPPPPACEPTWSFGNYYDSETCINGSLYYEVGYYEISTNCGYQNRSIVTGSGYCCPC